MQGCKGLGVDQGSGEFGVEQGSESDTQGADPMFDVLSDPWCQTVVVCTEASVVTWDPATGVLDMDDWDMDGFSDWRDVMIQSEWQKVPTADPNQPVVVGPQWEAAEAFLVRASASCDGSMRYAWEKDGTYLLVCA